MSIDTRHPDYKMHLEKWSLVDSVINNSASKFIRQVDRNDKVRNNQYRSGAILTNFTALTKEGLQGLVFRREPDIDLPTSLEYLKKDATGDSRGLEQISREVLGKILDNGRAGILVDFPRNEGSISIRDTENLKAKLIPYNAKHIINWETQKIGSEEVLKWVVLHEPTLQHPADDPFDWEEVDKYRLLELDERGIYRQAVYSVNTDSNGVVYGEKLDQIYPTDINGNNLNRIPFCFVGAADNNTSCDKAPLYDLAILNIGHYRNSADYEESVFVVGQPSLFVFTDIDKETFQDYNPSGINFGARSGHVFDAAGNATLLQANPNQLAEQAMNSKMKQAAFIGARLISEPGGRETAEAARLRYSSQNSALHVVVKNVDLAIMKALEYCTWYMGGKPEEISFKLNRIFYDESADPNLIAQAIMLYDRGLISREEIRDDLKQKNLIEVDKTIEELDEELANTDPFANIVPLDATNTENN